MLTLKQEAFVQELVKDKSQREAYRISYPRSQHWKDETVDSKACNLLKKGKVKARYEELMQKVIAEAEVGTIATATEVLQYLTKTMRNELTEEAVVVEGCGEGCSEARTIEKDVSIKDRNKAAELLAKKYGILTDKIQIDKPPTVIAGEDDLE